MREVREYGVTWFAKSFAHRAPGRHRMASARRRHVSLTVDGWPARNGELHVDNPATPA
ncbi:MULTISPECIES: hypothetical protein [Burkholderia]|uniref:hypothetical protein n=1 Tax=Burkholderia TaxID=32008 RepID=UPI001455E008|nr:MULTISPECIES: hypothetical protein [Burkholderia]MBJ9756437.1 hypothetical protein [Burkholderia cepacia]